MKSLPSSPIIRIIPGSPDCNLRRGGVSGGYSTETGILYGVAVVEAVYWFPGEHPADSSAAAVGIMIAIFMILDNMDGIRR